MANCEKLEKCPFFTDQMANMPSVAALLKKTFCLGDKTQCARYSVLSAGFTVPADLLPNDQDRASQILAKT